MSDWFNLLRNRPMNSISFILTIKVILKKSDAEMTCDLTCISGDPMQGPHSEVEKLCCKRDPFSCGVRSETVLQNKSSSNRK